MAALLSAAAIVELNLDGCSVAELGWTDGCRDEWISTSSGNCLLLYIPLSLFGPAVAQDWKRSIFIPISKKSSNKEYANHQTIALISHASKVMLKIFHARLQHYASQELPDVQDWFQEKPEIKLPTFT